MYFIARVAKYYGGIAATMSHFCPFVFPATCRFMVLIHLALSPFSAKTKAKPHIIISFHIQQFSINNDNFTQTT